MSERDTIFALSSGRPPAAIAVVRVSGPRAGAALERLIGRVPEARRATLARVRDPESGEALDQGLVLWFPAPGSETGEDTAEVQVHGGRAVIAAVLAALGKLEGLRPAERGEFTRRAFENGRMDLTAVEGLADLVAAETQAQRRQAYQHLKGLLGERAESWRRRLIEALAWVEACIDFSDEEDVPAEAMTRALEMIGPLADEIESIPTGHGERLRDGLRVAIAGPPNAGKSTLFNRLARREAAIVSPLPGTTRDVLEVHLDLGGYPVTVLDTAGIRASDDPVEREGVRRASAQAASADLVLWLVDASASARLGAGEALSKAEIVGSAAVWVVINKTDLVTEADAKRIEYEFSRKSTVHLLSAQTEAGVAELVTGLSRYAEEFFSPEPAFVARERQRAHLDETLLALRGAQRAATEGSEEIMAEQLRLACRALGKLLGRVDVEDVLDVIFRDFCIGK
ncbi:MAG TPA: tRNA uridine-5-carboxymethylaminomethyl(34) synthesis GTPase MnmE [Xanthobacteraceae bacterium]|jgi:tRNA modification GTPase